MAEMKVRQSESAQVHVTPRRLENTPGKTVSRARGMTPGRPVPSPSARGVGAVPWRAALTLFFIGGGIAAGLAARPQLAFRPADYGGRLADWMFLAGLVVSVISVILSGTIVVPWRRRDVDAVHRGRWRPWTAGFLAAAGLVAASLALSHLCG